MFDEDANDSRARAEQGRKNAEFRDLYQSIKLDIKDQSDAGANSTTYRLPRNSQEFVEPLVEHLTAEEFQVTVKDADGERPVLSITWEPIDSDD
ncbi:TPA: hypothetical protein QDB43_000320 [Burkholderia vietnamiensis]|uniref:hypothetical protein n=1 Tax=Burkholderia TaxID=32008 RepID=UPI000F05C826|nr:hypothetical protein [Burkholderia pseudomallei]MCW0163810.1 hypothetical protein [Burkholderia pseudomallei]VBG63316.1 Uncharacterised protein [Burkholderia pseudomallei]HDR9236635.1 hypothetical protein [Burkholderia vietnamiensis]